MHKQFLINMSSQYKSGYISLIIILSSYKFLDSLFNKNLIILIGDLFINFNKLIYGNVILLVISKSLSTYIIIYLLFSIES